MFLFFETKTPADRSSQAGVGIRDETCLLMDFKLNCHLVVFLKVFRFADTCLDRYEIAIVLWKQGSGVFCFPDLHVDGDHSPAIRHQIWYVYYCAAVLRRNFDEEPWRWPAPEDDLATELDVHWQSISNTIIPNWNKNLPPTFNQVRALE